MSRLPDDPGVTYEDRLALYAEEASRSRRKVAVCMLVQAAAALAWAMAGGV